MDQRLIVFILVTFIIIKNAIQGIIIPILAEFYQSLNFILIATCVQFIIIFGSIYVVLSVKSADKFKFPEGKIMILLIGIFNGGMAILMMYSANPDRTPVILQTILASLPVIPSFILRKLILNKVMVHNKILTILSLIFILTSVSFAIIPIISEWKMSSFGWIAVYFSGILCLSTYNVLQEKYTSEYDTSKLVDKIGIVFFGKIIELILILSLCWLEIFFGQNKYPYQSFVTSCEQFITNYKASLLLEGFIVAYMIAYMLAVYLNSINSNFNMISPVVSNPLVAIFFTVFSQYNNGIKYPIWIICCCVGCSIIGVVLWLFSEKISQYEKIKDVACINTSDDKTVYV